eukprot:947851-Amphidinium_carterae.1
MRRRRRSSPCARTAKTEKSIKYFQGSKIGNAPEVDKEQKQTDAEIQQFQTDKQRKLNQALHLDLEIPTSHNGAP